MGSLKRTGEHLHASDLSRFRDPQLWRRNKKDEAFGSTALLGKAGSGEEPRVGARE